MAATVFTVGWAGVAQAQPNQVAGAAGLVAAVVQVDRTLNDLQVLSDIGEINIVRVEDSLNNLQVLNRSPILSDNVVTVQDFLNNCTVLSCFAITDFLNDNNVVVSDVVAIHVLSGGDIDVFVLE
ncbi:MAG: hypothetical protein GEU78_00070 [Actinobacteria bacterium]|nr:hypothetical protein [Actinomycetota bacterium]